MGDWIEADLSQGMIVWALLRLPMGSDLYAYKVGRRCDGKNCFKVPGPGLKAHGIELDQPIV